MNLDFYKNKRILITGNTGFKGSWLSEILYLSGAEVIGYALKPDKESLYNILALEGKVTQVFGDIRDLELLEKTFIKYKPEIVIHMAAQPLVLESYKNPRYTFDVNMMGTLNILEVIRKTNCVKSFLNVTTDKVYLDTNDILSDGYKEDDKLCGRDPYSNSKSCSELVTYSYKMSFLEDVCVSTARSGNVIGGGDFSENRIIPDCIKAAVNHEIIQIRNPHSIRPYQHVLECLKGYLIVIEKQYNNKEYEGNYNFGPKSVDCVNTEMLVKIFCEKWGCNQEYINLNENSNKESNYLKLNSNLARTKLKWDTKWDIDNTIDKIVDWTKCYISNGDIVEKTDEQIREYFSWDV